MKRVFTLSIVCLLIAEVFAGFNPGTFKWQNKTRKYTIYVPDIYYTAGKDVPLLLGLHGFGDNIDNFSNICMTGISDTANYIAVYAEALPDPLLFANAWHSGASVLGVPFNNQIDDVGFLNALIDTVIAKYDIDTTRMYVYGFSFGAFMSHRMVSESTSRFAAAATVSGLRGNMLTATPTREIPLVHFHGTADQTINYYNCPYGVNAENTVKFYVNNNHCNNTPVIDSLPNTVADNKKIVRFRYNNGDNGSRVDFYKVIGGEHDWLGLPANDISYCQTIWSFFREFSRAGSIPTGIRNNTSAKKIELYPNPATNSLTFTLPANSTNNYNIYIFDASGKNVSAYVEVFNNTISIDRLSRGMYFLSIQTSDNTYTGRFVKP
jgi:polyhydroxybutyrate depolymerase